MGRQILRRARRRDLESNRQDRRSEDRTLEGTNTSSFEIHYRLSGNGAPDVVESESESQRFRYYFRRQREIPQRGGRRQASCEGVEGTENTIPNSQAGGGNGIRFFLAYS